MGRSIAREDILNKFFLLHASGYELIILEVFRCLTISY